MRLNTRYPFSGVTTVHMIDETSNDTNQKNALLINTITCWASEATVSTNMENAGPNAMNVQPKNDIRVILAVVVCLFPFLFNS